MDVKTVILGFLHYGDWSGYDLKQMFTSHIRFFYDASYGAIYPALRRLEEAGWVTRREVVQAGKPNKIVYAITEAGRRQFQREMSTTVFPPVIRSDMLVKLYFSGLRSEPERQQLLGNCLLLQKQMREEMSETYEQVRETLDEGQQLCWAYTFHHLDSTISFLEAQLARIAESGRLHHA